MDSLRNTARDGWTIRFQRWIKICLIDQKHITILFPCSPSREKAKTKLSQKVSGEGQRSKTRLSPGLLPGPEVTTPRRNTTGKKQPRRTDRSNSVEDNPSQTWSRANQHRWGRVRVLLEHCASAVCVYRQVTALTCTFNLPLYCQSKS